jgi:predicted nucleic acid-binding protein
VDVDSYAPLPLATAAAPTPPSGSSKSSTRSWAIALVVDAGPLYAYVDGDDNHHEACLELLETHPGPLIVPTLVITEVAYLIAGRLGWKAETRFLGDLAAGEMSLEPVDPTDILRIAELVARYHDLPLGTVDASVIAVAERLGVAEVATLDLRHFTVVRPRHVEAFDLLPRPA